jgi:hypothetical protein
MFTDNRSSWYKTMANELIRPIDPDSAHAIEETAKAAAKAIDAAIQAGKYGGEILGDLPHDLFGTKGRLLMLAVSD